MDRGGNAASKTEISRLGITRLRLAGYLGKTSELRRAVFDSEACALEFCQRSSCARTSALNASRLCAATTACMRSTMRTMFHVPTSTITKFDKIIAHEQRGKKLIPNARIVSHGK